MELSNSFEVTRPIDEAWAVLTDIERIAPCLPGAHLQEVEGDEYRGVVKVKVGPMTAQYKGVASFVERHDGDYKAVIKAKGRDTRGAGNAEATITAKLESLSDNITRVNVDTDLKITGRVAQFGRGVMADVSAKLMGQFGENLAAMLEVQDDEAVEPEPAPVVDDAGPRRIDMPEPEAIDLMEAAGTSIMKRVVPLVLVVVLALILRRMLRR